MKKTLLCAALLASSCAVFAETVVISSLNDRGWMCRSIGPEQKIVKMYNQDMARCTWEREEVSTHGPLKKYTLSYFDTFQGKVSYLGIDNSRSNEHSRLVATKTPWVWQFVSVYEQPGSVIYAIESATYPGYFVTSQSQYAEGVVTPVRYYIQRVEPGERTTFEDALFVR